MHHLPRLLPVVVLLVGWSLAGHGGTLWVEGESGAVWFSRNDARIPGDGGTRFDLAGLTGSGPDAYARLLATYEVNDRHAVRLALAPIEAEGTGTLPYDVEFAGTAFAAGTPTRAEYRFNTYRLTYRWTYHRGPRWQGGVGGALLVRDARIALRQGPRQAADDDLGVVPLLHLYGAGRLSERVSVVVDAEGAAAPQGRAIDAALRLVSAAPSGWTGAVGYRTLEGGADNDSVYTFAWLHHVLVSIGYRF